MRNLLDLVQSAARRSPDAQALVCGDVRVSYLELLKRSHALGEALSSFGIAAGERVAIFLDKRIETVVSMLGACAAGCVFVPVNPLLKPNQVAHVLRDSGARCLVTSAFRARSQAADGLAPVSDLIVVDAPDPALFCTGTVMVHRWPDRNTAAPGNASIPAPSTPCIDTDLAALLYTSGSTGLPKGVMLSHRNLLEGAWSVAEYLRHEPSDRILALLPLSFDAGLSQLTSAWSAGATAVLLNYLTAQDAILACERERVTAITGVPPLWMQLAGATWPDGPRNAVRYFANTGGRLPLPVLQKLRTLFPRATPYLMYGLTEAFRSTYLDPAQVDRRPDSIGNAVPNARILVVHEDGTPCAPDEPGELVHVGACVTLGYWNDAARTAQRYRPSPEAKPGGAPRDIAVWSGDLARRDSEGFLYFIARNDAQIKSSGYRISPEEIEETVHASGLVVEAVALGIPDDALGEAVALLVVLAGDSSVDDLRNWCVQRLPRYMVPRDIVSCTDIPRNPNGKFDRAALRNRVAALGFASLGHGSGEKAS
ncbi:acyl-CoA ligase (AMP-forming), exosortase A system-associated [Burkholderia gladioli pv. gladioli]|uniref:AMP-binding enzyme family protein n=1 Tax=Burkholderia gladioli TaxID=28095 RepID=A0A095G2S3_BURGA|nr:acyl-CoA ligase (AMP-forming), exosortase A system-associated [Burkholderia gladioli]AJX01025.1 AMP-binding enzyme family protein [Burkholderia gladioli]ASD80053.1 acyl-CoA ligase (AMP-forming), exosortase A system-associated [Burkholderia gladioli pv. gladioli]AWY54699.1 acyl-CoA ligase (AMP-forming), exosortase A system-associated [Burkholderia gladioli pv. gladioli]KGC11662.1 AMP-binding enzyme family protein [Burkholderia gladioli]MDJ1160339.1 acyl-CoA ligase (AMP-forming), exosortase A